MSIKVKYYNHVTAHTASERKENTMESRLLATLTSFASELMFPARVNFTGSITRVKKLTRFHKTSYESFT